MSMLRDSVIYLRLWCGWWCGVLCENCIVDASIHHTSLWGLSLFVCVVCVISYFFCENDTLMLMLLSVGVGVCLVFFKVTVVHPHG